MSNLHFSGLAAALFGLFALACGSTTGGPAGAGSGAQGGLTGAAFGQPFAAKDTLLVHPLIWKSADAGSTAILMSDTPSLCEQITSGTTAAPGRLVTVSLEQTAADGSVVDLAPGQFVPEGQGMPSTRYGEVFLSEVDAKCNFNKLFFDQSSIQVTSAGPKSSPVSLSIDVHFTSGDSLQGAVSAAMGCDQAAVDEYLNTSPKCQ